MRTERAILRAACLSLLLGGCAQEEVKAPHPTRSLDERRAIEVIRRAVKNEGVDPAPGRDEPLGGTSQALHIDVGVEGHAYGIAYVTAEDARALGAALPAPNKKDESLKLVRVGADGDTYVVLLFQQNYVYDDLNGAGHEQTTIAAESALARDAEDFITRARSKKYK